MLSNTCPGLYVRVSTPTLPPLLPFPLPLPTSPSLCTSPSHQTSPSSPTPSPPHRVRQASRHSRQLLNGEGGVGVGVLEVLALGRVCLAQGALGGLIPGAGKRK